jgi:F-type H+-transporting ATPase subunit delta
VVGNVVSRRYAKALVEIVRQDGQLDAIRDELKGINDVINREPGLFHFLSNPAVNVTTKQEVLDTIVQKVGASELTGKFLSLLLEKDRLRYLETVLFFYEELSYQIQNRLRAKVVSASPLNDDQRGEIINKLSDITGKRVELTVETEPDLIGGLVVQVGSTIYDGSLRNQLTRIKEELLGA